MTREETEAAAAWWADILRGPPIKDNGDEMQSIMGTLAAGLHRPPAEEQISAFERAVAGVVEERIDRAILHLGEDDWYVTVDTDYGPGLELIAALGKLDGAAAAAIRAQLPWKTVMWVEPGEVRVSKGYGAPERTVYPPANEPAATEGS